MGKLKRDRPSNIMERIAQGSGDLKFIRGVTCLRVGEQVPWRGTLSRFIGFIKKIDGQYSLRRIRDIS
jgi:hypothetical protein